MQRDKYKLILEAVEALGTVSKLTKERNTKVRIYLKVTTIADLVNKTGTYIPDDMMCREWRAESNLKQPKTARSGKKSWVELRKYIKAAFITGPHPH